MSQTFQILELDKPTINDWCATRESVEYFLENVYDGQDILGEISAPTSPENIIDNVSHKVKNLRIEGDFLCADIEPIDTPKGLHLRSFFDECVFLACLIGSVTLVDHILHVNDITHISCYPCHKDDPTCPR